MNCSGVALQRVILFAALAGCAASPTPDGKPAVIINPDATSRAELNAIIQTALHGTPVMLAADALTDTSILMIDHKAPRGLNAPPATGRVLGRGETFHLFVDGRQCVLKQESTGLRWLLLDTECEALAASQ